jgi:hypothetical protein
MAVSALEGIGMPFVAYTHAPRPAATRPCLVLWFVRAP